MKTHLIPGIYGKLPTLGDFVTRSLPADFISLWDQWIQMALQSSREEMGEHWLDCYLTCPIYRFVLGSGSCGEKSAAGVLMPSVDNVGRYFPLTIVALSHEGTPMAHLLLTQPDWFARLEELALSVLEDGFDFSGFEQQLKQQRLTIDITENAMPRSDIPSDNRISRGKDSRFFTSGVASINKLAPAFGYFCDHLLETTLSAYSLWSTNGSNEIAPSLTAYHGLPPASAYTDLISGLLQRDDWDQQTVERPSQDRTPGAESPQKERGDIV